MERHVRVSAWRVQQQQQQQQQQSEQTADSTQQQGGRALTAVSIAQLHSALGYRSLPSVVSLLQPIGSERPRHSAASTLCL